VLFSSQPRGSDKTTTKSRLLFTDRLRTEFLPDMLSQARHFFAEVKAELQKATWPWDSKEKGMKKYKELIDSTTIVIVGMVLLSGFVSLWDLVMMNIVGALTK
jgi:preprotein translocase subunit SecE